MRFLLLLIALGLSSFYLAAQPACVTENCCCGEPQEFGVPCGDFEAPPFANPIIVVFAGSSHCDWQVLDGSIDILGPNYSNWASGNPNGATQFIDLHGNTPGTMATTLYGLVPGYNYVLTLWYAKNAGASSANCRVQIAGGAWLDSTFTATNNGADGWLEKCYAFTAQGASAELRFTGSGGVTAGGVLLDDISLWGCPTDSEDPVVHNSPPNLLEIACYEPVPPADDLVVTDNCPGDIEIMFEETQLNQTCYYDLLRTWEVTDACGNTISLSQTIQVRDLDPPVFLIPPQDYITNCGSEYLLEFQNWIQSNGEGVAFDDCDQDVQWFADYIESPDGSCQSTLVTFVVTDECGNTTSATAQFIIADITPPALLIPAQDYTVYCAVNPLDSILVWIGNDGGAFAVDPCGPVVWTNDFLGDVSQPVLPVVFTATDGCGNTVETSALFIQISANDTLNLQEWTCDLNQAGVDTNVVQVQGCSSVTITTTTLLPSDTLVTQTFVCNPALAGNDTLFLMNAGGCDSLLITVSTLRPSDTIHIQISSCDPGQAGIDTVFLNNQYGCDSLVVIETFYTGQFIQQESQLICSSGQPYVDTIIVTGGPCDSLFITAYTFHLPDTTLLASTTCDPGMAGVFTQQLLGNLGCDSLVISTVSLLPSDSTFIIGKVCDALQAIHDTTYLVNQFGCDSVVYRDVAYVGIDTQFVFNTSCDSSQTGSALSIFPGPFCDTVVVTETSWSPYSLSQETIFSCDSIGPATDTLFLVNGLGCDSLHIRWYTYSDLNASPLLFHQSCQGLSDGEISIFPLGGMSPYTYQLNYGSWQTQSVFGGLIPGIYSVAIKDNQGCIREIGESTILPGVLLTVDAGMDIEAEEGEMLSLNATSSHSVMSVIWTAQDPLSCPTCLSTMLGPVTNSQTISLMIVSEEGCQASDAFQIILLEKAPPALFIPSSFSPNLDGINDVFSIYSNDIVKAINWLVIYDRWGNALYEQHQLPVNDPSQGWDGTYRGKIMDPGVYIYMAEIVLKDGQTRLYKGDITLVR